MKEPIQPSEKDIRLAAETAQKLADYADSYKTACLITSSKEESNNELIFDSNNLKSLGLTETVATRINY